MYNCTRLSMPMPTYAEFTTIDEYLPRLHFFIAMQDSSLNRPENLKYTKQKLKLKVKTKQKTVTDTDTETKTKTKLKRH